MVVQSSCRSTDFADYNSVAELHLCDAHARRQLCSENLSTSRSLPHPVAQRLIARREKFDRESPCRQSGTLNVASPSRLSRRASISLRAPAHQEALARLEYLVETGLRCGVVIGPKGAGKTTVLRAFADTFVNGPVREGDCRRARPGRRPGAPAIGRRAGTDVARPRPIGRPVARGGRPARRPPTVETPLGDHLRPSRPRPSRLPAGGGTAPPAQMRDSGAATFVLAFSGDSFPLVAKEWRQAADLRIEVAPLTAEETTLFVERLLSAVELPQDTFDSAAAEILFRLTRGVPRDVVRLCELSRPVGPAGRQAVDLRRRRGSGHARVEPACAPRPEPARSSLDESTRPDVSQDVHTPAGTNRRGSLPFRAC